MPRVQIPPSANSFGPGPEWKCRSTKRVWILKYMQWIAQENRKTEQYYFLPFSVISEVSINISIKFYAFLKSTNGASLNHVVEWKHKNSENWNLFFQVLNAIRSVYKLQENLLETKFFKLCTTFIIQIRNIMTKLFIVPKSKISPRISVKQRIFFRYDLQKGCCRESIHKIGHDLKILTDAWK